MEAGLSQPHKELWVALCPHRTEAMLCASPGIERGDPRPGEDVHEMERLKSQDLAHLN